MIKKIFHSSKKRKRQRSWKVFFLKRESKLKTKIVVIKITSNERETHCSFQLFFESLFSSNDFGYCFLPAPFVFLFA